MLPTQYAPWGAYCVGSILWLYKVYIWEPASEMDRNWGGHKIIGYIGYI